MSRRRRLLVIAVEPKPPVTDASAPDASPQAFKGEGGSEAGLITG